jgi:hypothetical protein
VTALAIVAAFALLAVMAGLVEGAPTDAESVTRFDRARAAMRRATDRLIEEAMR